MQPITPDTKVEALVKRMKTAFRQHKTEMLIAAGVGFCMGAVIL